MRINLFKFLDQASQIQLQITSIQIQIPSSQIFCYHQMSYKARKSYIQFYILFSLIVPWDLILCQKNKENPRSNFQSLRSSPYIIICLIKQENPRSNFQSLGSSPCTIRCIIKQENPTSNSTSNFHLQSLGTSFYVRKCKKILDLIFSPLGVHPVPSDVS